MKNPDRVEMQPDGRLRFYGYPLNWKGRPCGLLLLRTGHAAQCLSGQRRTQEVVMKLHDYEDTDSLYIDLSGHASCDSRKLSKGLVMDYDADGRVVGFDIQHASQHLDLTRIETMHLPLAS